MPSQTVSRLAFKATRADIECLNAIAATLRQSGHPFITRTQALRACLAVAAADPTRVIAVSSK